ncbi:oligosaccharide repeat unit polymerase [Nodosilinea sp. FACHB-131]|uniref:O-antigen polymerase n=1 Tax=Cyanophyceae TaxID=3028117 RepID=UPI0016890435|nr:O-antigen polymerase [Nodosilinea sp. FACHB-131]MBD1876699.1 oligosaccharide repeat unit polymerase [Nodosilinea sp. FACHB-131]
MNHLSLAPQVPALDASASPFVAMTPLHRFAVGGVLIASLVWLGIYHFLHPTGLEEMEGLFLALGLNGLLLLAPVIAYQPTFGWFHPLVFGLLFTYLDHLRRVDVYLHGLQWHAALPGWSAESLTALLNQELLLQGLGLLAWYGGYFLSPTLPAPAVQFHRPRHLAAKVSGAVLFSAALFSVYMQSRGGIVSHILSWGAGRNEALAGAFYWQFFTQLGLIGCLSWLVLDLRSTAQPLFWVCTLLSLAMAYLTGGSRSSVIYFMIMGVLAWLMRERKMAVIQLVAIALVGLFLMGILGNLRASTYGGTIDWNVLRGGAPTASTGGESAMTSGLSEVSQRTSVYSGVFPIIGLVPDQVDFIYGSSYLAVLTLPVPRGLWPEKPGLVAGMVGETFFDMPVGMPPGGVGEAYWNFGVPGVAIAFFLFGIFTRWLTDSFRYYADQPAAIVLYVITLFLLAEPSGLSIIAWLMMLVPAVAFLMAIGAMTLGRSPGD